MERVVPPPMRASNPEDEEVGLTSGEKLPRQAGFSRAAVLATCLAATLVGAGLGLLLAPSIPPSWNLPAVAFPASAGSSPLHFLVVGDWGRDGDFNQTVNAEGMAKVAASLGSKFVVSTGDNFYMLGLANTSDPQFDTSFRNIYTAKSLDVPWYAVLGNHDYRVHPEHEISPALRQRDRRWHCERSFRRRFSACSGTPVEACPWGVEVFFYDTSPLLNLYWPGQGQETLNFSHVPDRQAATDFQTRELRGWLAASDAQWKIVVGHHPVFSSGKHGGNPELEEAIAPLLKEFNVDLYVNGHQHILELVKMNNYHTYFMTSGAGSQLHHERTELTGGEVLFYHDLQGFASISVAEGSAEVRYHDAWGNTLRTLSLAKQ